MILAIESIVLCIVFTLILVPALYKKPINQIMSYPKAIRERVKSLPQYKDKIREKQKRHILVKIGAVVLFGVILGIVAYFSGAKDFVSAYVHVFILFFVVNLYDVIVLDLGMFCHSQKLRIPGTEDMDKEYRSPWHHIIGGVKGIGIGAVVSLISAGIVCFF